MELAIGDKVLVGDRRKGQRERVLEVYEAIRADGSRYLALRGKYERNGALRFYLEGLWGGVQRKL